MLSSYDIQGPIVRPRSEAFWTWVDPLGFRRDFRYDFTLDVFDAVETESVARVVVAGNLLKKGGTYNDYYGFGKSRDGAMDDAQKFDRDLAGASIDIIVTTTVKTQTVFHDPKTKVFYSGAVRCFHAPGSWRRGRCRHVLQRGLRDLAKRRSRQGCRCPRHLH